MEVLETKNFWENLSKDLPGVPCIVDAYAEESLAVNLSDTTYRELKKLDCKFRHNSVQIILKCYLKTTCMMQELIAG